MPSNLMSKHPGLRFGPFEFRPVEEAIKALFAERRERMAKDAKR